MQKDKKLIAYSRDLRRNMTGEERHLWYDFLKTLPMPVNRQRVIGQYIADFYISSAKIVIELDGSQHFEDEGLRKDAERDKCFEKMGILVLRYSNYDIKNSFDVVCQDILNNITDRGER